MKAEAIELGHAIHIMREANQELQPGNPEEHRNTLYTRSAS